MGLKGGGLECPGGGLREPAAGGMFEPGWETAGLLVSIQVVLPSQTRMGKRRGDRQEVNAEMEREEPAGVGAGATRLETDTGHDHCARTIWVLARRRS